MLSPPFLFVAYAQKTKGLKREKRTVGRPRTLTDSARKKLKRARDKILIPITVYLGDQYERWTKKKQEQSETRFPESVALLHILTWNYVLSILNLKEVLYKSFVYVHWVACSIRTFSIYFQTYVVRFHSKPCVVNTPTL